MLSADTLRAKLVASGDPTLATLTQEPVRRYGADAPDSTPAADSRAAYFRAAQALLSGRNDEAASGALGVVAGDSPLVAEAFVVAAKAAEALGDAARARRMYARAFVAAFPYSAARPVRLPEESLYAVAVAHPGTMTLYKGGWVNPTDSTGAAHLTQDGRHAVKSDGGTVVVRAVPTLTIRFAHGSAAAMALDDAGYYELLGDPPPAFRAAASCGELPLEVCADRFEVKGLQSSYGLPRRSVDLARNRAMLLSG